MLEIAAKHCWFIKDGMGAFIDSCSIFFTLNIFMKPIYEYKNNAMDEWSKVKAKKYFKIYLRENLIIKQNLIRVIKYDVMCKLVLEVLLIKFIMYFSVSLWVGKFKKEK